jgi:hypothetical protein
MPSAPTSGTRVTSRIAYGATGGGDDAATGVLLLPVDGDDDVVAATAGAGFEHHEQPGLGPFVQEHVPDLAVVLRAGGEHQRCRGEGAAVGDLEGVLVARRQLALGWVSIALLALGCALGRRAARTLLRDSVRFRRSDLRWFSRWPGALLTGRFGHHDGHFDPGQRLANLVMLASLLLLVGSGAGLAIVSGGPVFVWLNLVHRWATYVFTPLVLGHIVIASGVLPGYRGVWRAMHLGGRVHEGDARRVWPGWTDRGHAFRR